MKAYDLKFCYAFNIEPRSDLYCPLQNKTFWVSGFIYYTIPNHTLYIHVLYIILLVLLNSYNISYISFIPDSVPARQAKAEHDCSGMQGPEENGHFWQI